MELFLPNPWELAANAPPRQWSLHTFQLHGMKMEQLCLVLKVPRGSLAMGNVVPAAFSSSFVPVRLNHALSCIPEVLWECWCVLCPARFWEQGSWASQAPLSNSVTCHCIKESSSPFPLEQFSPTIAYFHPHVMGCLFLLTLLWVQLYQSLQHETKFGESGFQPSIVLTE